MKKDVVTWAESARMMTSQVAARAAGARERLEGVKARQEVRHVPVSKRTCGGQVEMDGLGGLGLKTTMQAGFLV